MLRALAVASLSVHAAALSTMAAHLAADARSARSLDDYVFEFDLQGYCVVRGVLDADEVAAANAAIDARAHELRARDAAELRNARAGTSLAGAGSRLDLGGALGWPAPDRDVFRAVLAHPRLVPLLHRLVGEGYRLDHLPLIIASDEGAEGFALHGGPLHADGALNPSLQYRWAGGGRAYNSLLAASVQLCDHDAGDGGFVVVPGSHKLNVPVPDALTHGDGAWAEQMRQPATRAGDVVLFSEATVHGARPWTRADKQRRIALYRFAPAHVAYGRTYSPEWPAEMLDGATPAQRAVLEPPYACRLDRPRVEADGVGVKSDSRSAAKKAFDREVFHTPYF